MNFIGTDKQVVCLTDPLQLRQFFPSNDTAQRVVWITKQKQFGPLTRNGFNPFQVQLPPLFCIEKRNLNPDPTGGYWTDPPLFDRWWYPLYEKMVELDVPAMIHVSSSCNPHFHFTGCHYINGDTAAFMQVLTSDLFKDFPTLKFIIPHGGGAVPFHWGRYRGLAQDMGKPTLDEHLLNNVFFDTCVYHQPGIDCMTKVIPTKNILFASEMVGAVRGVDPETGYNYDDTKRYIDGTPNLTDAERADIFSGNVQKVFSRLKV